MAQKLRAYYGPLLIFCLHLSRALFKHLLQDPVPIWSTILILIGNDLDTNPAPSRAIQFEEEDSLPRSQGQTILLNRNYNAISKQHGSKVGMGIALSMVMPVACTHWSYLFQEIQYVCHQSCISFIHSQSSSCMKSINQAGATLYTALKKSLFYVSCNIYSVYRFSGINLDHNPPQSSGIDQNLSQTLSKEISYVLDKIISYYFKGRIRVNSS